MILNLEHVYARIENAKRHREAMTRIHNEYRSAHPIEEISEIGDGAARLFVKASHPYPHEMSIKFGEWANGLRAALDSLFYEIAIFDTGQNPPTRKGDRVFRICRDEEKFDRHASLKGLHPWTIENLRICQPFRSPTGEKGHALYWLHELAKIDRHRHLFNVEMIVHGVDINIPSAMARYTSPELVTLCDETTSFIGLAEPLQLAEIAFRTPVPPKIAAQIGIRYVVGFDVPGWMKEVHHGYQWRFDFRMDSVEQIVEKLTHLFSQHIVSRTEFDGTISLVDGGWVRD